jgi:putative oxidoreductase
MTRWLGKYSSYFYALLRIVAGLMFAMHGSQKLLGWPPAKGPGSGDMLFKVAGVIELVGGLLIALGLFASIAAVIASGEMAVAYFMVQAPNAPLPILNGGELAVLYCFLFLYIASVGSGVWSIDALRGGRRT